MNATIENKPRALSHVRAAIFGQPWAITEAAFNQILAIAETHVEGRAVSFESDSSGGDDLGFEMIQNCAIIPVSGPIFPKANLMTQLSGATSLEQLKSAFMDARSMKPNAIIADFDTPGGSVQGLADFCEWLSMFCGSMSTPCLGLVNPLCASAGYMIASQLDMLYSTGGGMSGSIGVIAKVDNRDRQERNSGNDPVIFRSSELKGIGAGPMTPNQQTEMQAMVMAHFAKFQDAVKRGRTGIDIDAVSTGQIWHGKSATSQPSAVDMGIVDGVSTMDSLIQTYGSK